MILPLLNLPNTRADFKKYCLRRLGAPVIKINVSNEQCEDRINDALLYFFDYHFEGTEKTYFKYQVTGTDIDNKYITLPDNILGAVRMFVPGGAFNMSSMFSYRYQFTLNDLYPLVAGSVLTYYMTMTHLSFLEQLFVGQQPINFNRYNNQFRLDDWSQFLPGMWIVVEAYTVIDPTVYPKLWSDRWLGQYATALIKRQWGEQMKKFVGMQMPGGMMFSGQQIWNEATEEIKELEHFMINSYSLPVSDMIG